MEWKRNTELKQRERFHQIQFYCTKRRNEDHRIQKKLHIHHTRTCILFKIIAESAFTNFSNNQYSEPNQSRSSHLCLGLPISLFPLSIPIKILKASLPSSILAISSAYLNILEVIALTCQVNGPKYQVPQFEGIHLGANIHFRILFSYHFSLCSSHNVRDHIS